PPAVSSEVRSRRPPRDPINVLLSLGYTLAHHEAVAAAYAVGLDPYIGFLHEIAAGRESLACDLTEFLRQMVDDWVVNLLQAETLRKEHFSRENDGSCLLGKAGRAHFYRTWARIAPTLRRLARRYARWMVASMQEQGVPAA
ncbi:MAG: CRISPR-associated endonuclease Cas1, partial [Terracidiphilus sp.]